MIDFTFSLRSLICGAVLAVGLNAMADEGSISIVVSDITMKDAKVTLTPSPSNLSYIWDFAVKEKFIADGGAEKAIENKIETWKKQADYYNDGTTWQEMMSYGLNYSPMSTSIRDYFYDTLASDTEYVVYAFGMDYSGNVTAPVTTAEFKTPAPATSDITFSAVISPATPAGYSYYKVTASVTPSNDDRYMARFFLKDMVDRYNVTPGSSGEKEFINEEMLWYPPATSKANGPHDFIYEYCELGKDYYLVIMGINDDDTPSTGLTLFPFTPKEAGKIEFAVSDITSQDATITLTPTPADLTYYWNVMDKETFLEKGGADKVIENRIEVWEGYANMYHDGSVWQDIMIQELQSGPQTTSLYNAFLDTLMYDTEYVVYGFGMDNAGNVTAPVSTIEFKTEATQQSDNTFQIEVTAIQPGASYYYNAIAHVTPSNNDRYLTRFFTKDFVDKFNITPGSTDEKRFIANEMLRNPQESMMATGEHDFTYNYCELDKDYYVVVMGINDDMTPSTSLTLAEFTAAPIIDIKGTIELEVSDITPMNAHIRIVPSDENMRYYYSITTPEVIENKGGIENIPEKLIIDWWKYIADMYGDEYTWQSFIPMQTTTGIVDDTVENLVKAGELEEIYWAGHWVLYAVGFDLEGNVLTEPAVLEFDTPDCGESDITFKFNMLSKELNETKSTEKYKYYDVEVEIIPSNDEETYRINCMPTRFYNQYLEDEVPDMFEFITRQFLGGSDETTGTQTVSLTNLVDVNSKNEPIEYGVFAIGWNEGPTTDIFCYSFDLTKEDGLDNVTKEALTFNGENGSLSIKGAYNHAAVYSIDGKLAGLLKPGHSLSLQSGIYIVRYTTLDGIETSRKVLVK